LRVSRSSAASRSRRTLRRSASSAAAFAACAAASLAARSSARRAWAAAVRAAASACCLANCGETSQRLRRRSGAARPARTLSSAGSMLRAGPAGADVRAECEARTRGGRGRESHVASARSRRARARAGAQGLSAPPRRRIKRGAASAVPLLHPHHLPSAFHPPCCPS
jgi:hypothetical protein